MESTPAPHTTEFHRIFSLTQTDPEPRKSLFTNANTKVCVFKDLMIAKTKTRLYIQFQGYFRKINREFVVRYFSPISLEYQYVS